MSDKCGDPHCDCMLPAPDAPAARQLTPELLAQRFHETYERLAPSFGYTTREASAKPWADVPEQNKRLMIAVCAEILLHVTARAVRAEGERDRLRAEREMIADDSCFWYEDGGSPFFKSADDDAPRAIDPVIKICVNANDAFAWGTADAEPIPDDQFWRLYRIWQLFGHAGAIAWAMEHRGVEKLFMSYKEPFESQLQAARRTLAADRA